LAVLGPRCRGGWWAWADYIRFFNIVNNNTKYN